MLLGFLSALPFIGIGFAFAVKLFLSYIIYIISAFSKLPFASLEIHYPWWVLLALTGLILLAYSLLRQKDKLAGSIRRKSPKATADA